jgi:hypothetical protein
MVPEGAAATRTAMTKEVTTEAATRGSRRTITTSLTAETIEAADSRAADPTAVAGAASSGPRGSDLARITT